MGGVAAALLIGIGVRVYLVSTMSIISRDGVTFIWYAQRIATGPVDEIRRQKQHPLYPALIAAAHGALERAGVARTDDARRWVIAGEAVAFAASLGVIPAVYLLTSVLFARRVAVVAAACAAVLPEFCRYGVDVLSDSLHLLLYLSALTAGLSGVGRRSWWRLGFAGLFSGLAFLVRPEGGEAALIVVVAVVLVRHWSLQRRVGCAAACAAGFLLIASPYMLATGRVVQKKSILRFFRAEAATRCAGSTGMSTYPCHPVRSARTQNTRAPSVANGRFCPPVRAATAPYAAVDFGAIGRGAWSVMCAAGKTLLNWVRSLRVVYLLPAVAWFFLGDRRPRACGIWRIVFMAWVLHVIVCVLLIPAFDYWNLFSLRHVLVLAALTLPWTAAGLVGLVDLMTAARLARLTPGRAWLLAAMLMVMPTLPWLLRPPNREYTYLRRAGEWIGDHYPRPQRVMTDQWHVPFYARAQFCERYEKGWTIRWPGTADAAELVAWIRREQPTIVVLDEARLRKQNATFFEDLDRLAIAPGLLRLVHTVGSDDAKHPKRAFIYEVRAG